MVAEEIANGVGFESIADRRRCAVCVYISDVAGFDARIAHGIFHYSKAAFVLRRGLGHVIRVPAHTVADNFGYRRGPTRPSAFELFLDQNRCAFSDLESVRFSLPGPVVV